MDCIRAGFNGGIGKCGGLSGDASVIRKDSEELIKDRFILCNSGEESSFGLIQKNARQAGSIYKSLQKPEPSVRKARNESPVVIVHGTMSDKESIREYLTAALDSGHPADLRTYLTIKEGQELEKSASIVSENVNESRMELAEKNVRQLKSQKGDIEGIKKFFYMDDSIYGKRDKSVDEMAALIPGVVDKMESLLSGDKKEMLSTFSTRVSGIERNLGKAIEKTSFANEHHGEKRSEICHKAAAEIMDTICPKAILAGHSMGGFVNYIIALNPREGVGDDSKFTYDAGNGVSTVMTIGSPIKKGVSDPLPKGLADMTFNIMDKHFLSPMESAPGMQLAMINPFFSMWYAAAKEMTKITYHNASMASSAMMNPAIHMQKPGYKQIAEGSEFCRNYLYNKQIPKGITFISITNKDDGVSEKENSVHDGTKPNALNLDADVTLDPTEYNKKWDRTKPCYSHMVMGSFPTQHWQEFKEEVIGNPGDIPKLLDRSNYDGMRWNALIVLKDEVSKDRNFFNRDGFKEALDAVRETASEKLPFTDSPSFVAGQILDIIDEKPPQTPQGGDVSGGSWILSQNPEDRISS